MTLIAIAAYQDWHPGVPAGKVKIIATRNGRTAPHIQRRAFLVDFSEYSRARGPMVIDPARHKEVK